MREKKKPRGLRGTRKAGGSLSCLLLGTQDRSDWGPGLFHTNWARSQVPSRDLLETQGVETSVPDAGAGSPTVSHSSDSWLDNAQWKQKKEAQWWETHQMTARNHAPHTLKRCNLLLKPGDYLQ